jgi:succinate-acetate transporter protein
MALVTFWGALGALAQNVLVFLTFGVLTAASAVTAAGFWAGSLGTIRVGGWLFVISAAAAWLAAGAMVLEHSFGRTIIPVGKWSRTVNRPGARVTDPITYPGGMPGVKVGR